MSHFPHQDSNILNNFIDTPISQLLSHLQNTSIISVRNSINE